MIPFKTKSFLEVTVEFEVYHEGPLSPSKENFNKECETRKIRRFLEVIRPV